ncbi:hypothetical protein HY439_03085 [Candidatus Microgenomates bacterium]|nr:hypothetical protein [Candidatus Microgenomates bacterium]
MGYLDNVITPRIDEYINTLLEKASEYELNNHSKNILNYVIYILLNKDFQYLLRGSRLSIYIPIDGFKSEPEFQEWQQKIHEVVTEYRSGKIIDPKIAIMIKKTEESILKKLARSNAKRKISHISRQSVCQELVNTPIHIMMSFLKLRDTRNMASWIIILRQLLILLYPERILKTLENWNAVFDEQSINIRMKSGKRVTLSITLYPGTTFKDLEELIERNRKNITIGLTEIKSSTRDNESKTDDIKRDYFIYRSYINHKTSRQRGDKIYSNVKKEEAVKDKAEKSIDRKEAKRIKYLELESIRKIVNRMNKRIKNAVPDKLDNWSNLHKLIDR